MGQTFGLLLDGLTQALSPTNLLFALVGCVLGTLIGVLPGLGPASAMAILIPVTYDLGPVPAIIMLAAIYYGTQYGGTITSVLVNVPGESTSVVTCLDGHPLARQGRAGTALGVAAIGSLVAGIVGTLALVVLALPLANLALKFGPVEMFALLLLGLTLVMSFRGRSFLAALAVTLLGLMLATVGIDPVQGAPRLTFDNTNLFDGVQLVPVIMGLFGIAELLRGFERPPGQVPRTRIRSLLPTRPEARRSAVAIARGTGVGFGLGLIPGVPGVVPTFVSYALEKRLSRHPERFGRGAVEGVATAESANNSYAQASMVPLLTLGIPGTATVAVLMGAFLINGITPGPFLFRDHPDVVWALIASFLVGNVILFVLNFPLVGVWAKILRIPHAYLRAMILLFCVIGAYTLRQSTFDIGVMLVFGVLGYLFDKLEWPTVPLVIALILGPMLEKNLRAALELSGGDATVFLTAPISAVLLAVATAVVVLSLRGAGRIRAATAGLAPAEEQATKAGGAAPEPASRPGENMEER
ncbi:tripartite tricarboxylate transporter permease [Phytohabitans kaempferiae]|uniref:Tripartite tricarboxylate transporter permease n=1 Tax=Phytohabitans kaempferiae TaxID=1620943 RepID=A0ABV6MAQ0_9ACTN